MNKITIPHKDSNIRNMIIGAFFVLGFVWVNTFVRQNSFEGNTGAFSLLGTVLMTMGYTSFYYWLLNSEMEMGADSVRDSTKMCSVITAIANTILLFAFLLEMGTESFSLYGEKKVILWVISIPKKYLYDFWAVIIFPLNIQTIFRAMRRERFDSEAVFFGGISILSLTLEGSLIFMVMGNIWLVDLMILNTITLAFAVWKYALPEKYIRMGSAAAAVIMYALFRLMLLAIQCDGWGGTAAGFMYAGSWSEYMAGINELVRNAAFFGTSDTLLSSALIHHWLFERNKPILQLLFYGGWSAVIVFIMSLICFVVLILKLLGGKNGRKHKNYLMYASAAVMLIIRAVFGALYNFGFPYPVALPFCGSSGIIMDTMAFTLLLWGAWENRRINKYGLIETKFVPVTEILGVQEEYRVLDEDGENYGEEVFDDEVDVIGGEKNVHCIVDWFTVCRRDFCVFIETGSDRRRFILEYSGTKWIPINDLEQNIQKQIQKKYVHYNKPDCMEDIEYETEIYED